MRRLSPPTVPTTDYAPLQAHEKAVNANQTSGRFSVVLNQLRRKITTNRQARRRAPPYLAAGFFGALVPYFDRAFLRFSTPRASSVPRTMW